MRFWPEKPQESATKAAIRYVAVFVSAAAAYGYVEDVPAFRDPDSFYHAKMAQLLASRGIVHDFTWLPFTTLARDFADHHFLYHLLLVPFVRGLGPFAGMTVATVLFAALAMTLYLALLRVHGVRHAWAYVFVLATSSAFVFRLNLAKTSALSLSFIFAALIAMRKDRPLALFAIAWLYVLLYGGWPILAVVVGTFLLARAVVDAVADHHPVRSWASVWFWKRLFGGSRVARSEFFSARETRQALAVAAGLLCGVVLNPYFPANVHFYWDQIVQIALIGHPAEVGVGSEWYPYKLGQLLNEAGAVFLLGMISVTGFACALCWPDALRRGGGAIKRSEATPIVASWTLALLFLGMALRSKRHVEYFAPFAALAGALLLDALLRRFDLAALRKKLAEALPKGAIAVPAVAAYLVATFVFLGVRDVRIVHGLYKEGVAWTRFAGAGSWLAAHAPAEAIVFHSNWDEFPPLFFRDDRQRYIIGLDPTFLFLRDPVRYRLWTDVTTGKVTVGAAEMVRRVFGARYVLVASDHQAMLDAFRADPTAIRVYKDADCEIFKLL